MMRVPSLACLVAALLFTWSAEARDAKVGARTVSVSPPAGFCEVDKTNKADSSWLTSVTNLMDAAKIYVIAAFPDCKELKQMRKTGQFIDTKIYITAPYGEIGKSSSKHVSDTCDELRTKEYSAEDKAKSAKEAEQFANGNSFADSKSLGILDETKGEVCYVATLQKTKTKAGDLLTMLGLFTVSNVQDNLLFLYQYTPYVDAKSMDTALANLKIVYSDFTAHNKK